LTYDHTMTLSLKELSWEAKMRGKSILRFLFDHHVYTKMKRKDFNRSACRNAGRYVSITEDSKNEDAVILKIKIPSTG
jgi:hypothetical protein